MPLTEQQTRKLRDSIEQRRNVLIREMQEDAARVRDEPYVKHAGVAPDSGDASLATLIADLEQADLTRDLGEFRALETARERLHNGVYGVCQDCGSDIGFARLKASPIATRCITCQTRPEKTFAGEPKPSL